MNMNVNVNMNDSGIHELIHRAENIRALIEENAPDIDEATKIARVNVKSLIKRFIGILSDENIDNVRNKQLIADYQDQDFKDMRNKLMNNAHLDDNDIQEPLEQVLLEANNLWNPQGGQYKYKKYEKYNKYKKYKNIRPKQTLRMFRHRRTHKQSRR